MRRHDRGRRRAGEGTVGRIGTDHFLGCIARVLDEGSANSTHKWALLLGLVDAAPLLSVSQAIIDLQTVAEAAARILRPQVRPYRGERVLTQVPHREKTSRLLDIVASWTEGPLPKETASKVAWELAQWPVPRLQIIGGDVVPFLWRVPDVWARHVKTKKTQNKRLPRSMFDVPEDHDGVPVLSALPGAIDCLVKLAPILRPAIEIRWSDQVAALNRACLPKEWALRQFLFPDERRKLNGRLREGLAEIQRGRCFWCQGDSGAFRGAVVDHVVPWSLSRNDAIENLVLVDSRCNEEKADWLLHPELALRWLRHARAASSALGELARSTGLLSDPKLTEAWAAALYRTLSATDGWRAFCISGETPGRVVLPLGEAERVLRFLAAPRDT